MMILFSLITLHLAAYFCLWTEDILVFIYAFIFNSSYLPISNMFT